MGSRRDHERRRVGKRNAGSCDNKEYPRHGIVLDVGRKGMFLQKIRIIVRLNASRYILGESFGYMQPLKKGA